MATTQDETQDFRSSLSKVDTFLKDRLSREPLSLDAEKQRQECIRYIQGMMSATRMNGDSNLLRVGLSHSTQELNETADAVNGITRSDSLPDVCAIQGLHKHSDLEQDVNINDFRQLILYEPIQEDDDTETEDKLKLSSNNIKEACMSPKRSRKRDSAALFDITLGDLTEPDFAGFLTEKHSGKQWWCVLQDMHLCMFPSPDPDEVAYDVIIMPCCQITLDDRLLRTPVFRLTQSDMAPWVLVAKDTDYLKEWMNVLTVATTGGSFGATSKPPEKPATKVAAKPQMFAIEEEQDDSIEEILEEVPLTCPISFSGELSSKSIKSSEVENETIEVAAAETSHSSPPSEALPAIPTMTFNEHEYGDDLYEPIVALQGDGFEDDGFATDEFDSGSSDGEAVNNNALASAQQGRKVKKKKFFKWLKKKSKKYKLFSSPEEGVTLAGYAQRLENNACAKRWFLIREGKLHCHKTIKDEEPEEVVLLDGTDIKVGDEDKNRMCVKVLKDGAIKFVLVTKSQKDIERWKTALKLESGFVKHGSPTSSGIYDEEEEGDNVMPASSPSLQRESFPSSSPPAEDSADGFDDQEDEDLYMEIIATTASPSISHSPSHEALGPLPAIPLDLPPRPEKCEEAIESDDESDEVYEEVTNSLPNADKINQWGEREVKTTCEDEDLYLNDSGRKEETIESDDESDEVYEEVTNSLPNADKINQWGEREVKTSCEDEDLYLNDSGRKEETREQDIKDVEKNNVELKEEKKLNKTEENHKAKGPVPVGVEDGSIPDSAITASSFLENSKPSFGRLNTKNADKHTGAWCPKTNDKAQFLQLDLGDTFKVCAVATQGRADCVEDGGWYVKTYTVAYSKDGENWVNYKEFGIAKVFQGNTDSETAVTNPLKRAVNAQYVRIKPQTWSNHIAMRVEIYKGEASSKLEAGIHKLAATLTKAGKGKVFDKQLTSPTEIPASKSSFDDIASPTEKSPLARRVSFDKSLNIITGSKGETKQEGGDEDGKRASTKEVDVEAKVQQKIEDAKRADGGVRQTISKANASGSILEKRSLHENVTLNCEAEQHGEKMNVKSSTTLQRNVEKSKAEKTEKTTETTAAAASVTDADREREMLEKTEQAFQEYAKQLKSDDTSGHKMEKRPSIVAMQKMNFERSRGDKESKTLARSQTPAKCQELLKEKAELTTKLEALKRRVTIAKDRKVFFGRSDGKNTAATAADKELQNAQAELTKTKERLQAIESEAKNAKVLELRYQKTTVDNSSKKPTPMVRQNSREVKVGTIDKPAPKVDSKNFNPDGEKAQRVSVLSQIKAFEKLKE